KAIGIVGRRLWRVRRKAGVRVRWHGGEDELGAGRFALYEAAARPRPGRGNFTPAPAASQDPGPVRQPQHTRPAPDPSRAAVLEFCYDGYIVLGLPQGEVLQQARLPFGEAYAPKTTMHVRVFSRQWASRWTPPLPLTRLP